MAFCFTFSQNGRQQKSPEQVDASVQVNNIEETNEKGTQADIPLSVINENCQMPTPPLDEDTLKNVTLVIKKGHSYAKPVEPKTLPKTQCTTGINSKQMSLVDVETVSSIDSRTQEAMASVGTSLSELLINQQPIRNPLVWKFPKQTSSLLFQCHLYPLPQNHSLH